MKTKLLGVIFAGLLAPITAFAAGGGVELEKANIDVHNKASLQRGAKYFANYCQGCHSLKFSRYNRVAKDLGLTEEQVKENLIFTRGEDGEPSKVGDLMVNAISQKNAAEWFGAPPPDLSLVGRSRSGDWIYSYLNAFYLDPSRPMGVNNTVFPNVGMPHVLGELQGWKAMQTAEAGEHDKQDGEAHAEDDAHHGEPQLVMVKKGTMSEAEYEQMILDLTNYLVYVSEPAQLHRKTYGVYVLLFLALLFVFSYFLKKEYWKDIH
ncbi:MAG TPA: cytochrome c1 [Thiothrix sp.]|nr:cytochrome c1 [Thiothrix sp.]